ncbi:MAG: HAD-IC family P-type ATPase [Oscillospiraceae bacterium]
MKSTNKTNTEVLGFTRRTPSPMVGLSADEAALRMQCGAHNAPPQGAVPGVWTIIRKNTFTLFNLINLLLAIALLFVGPIKNILFLGVALCNTAMGIIQELRARRTLNKLSVLAQGKAEVLRDGQPITMEQAGVVVDDVLLLRTGAQICAGGIVLEAQGVEIDESLLTGETDKIQKQPGDKVLSGSFVVSGTARVHVTSVGQGSYANAITLTAKKEKKAKTPLMRTLNNIIRVLTVAILPIGALLFYQQYTGTGSFASAVLGTSTAVLGIIPEGLILLTGVTLTVGALKLAGKKALVQTLPSIETLARVDVNCLDKTGTITDGTLSFEKLVPQTTPEGFAIEDALREMMAALDDTNATAVTLRKAFVGKPQWHSTSQVPFASDRKWSSASFEDRGTFVLGAPGFVFENLKELPFYSTVTQYATDGYRVLCLAHSGDAALQDKNLPQNLTCLGLIVLSDTIRPEAPDTFRFFENEGVTLKVISGDDPVAVSTIAQRAGISNAQKYIDVSQFAEDHNFATLAEEYAVFGRVSPVQKKGLIGALKQNGHTACMTGDGVNDVLAMKEADCSVAMINGSDAARGTCDFVLMTSDFSAMVDVLREGRRVINNIERVACLYLVKTIYSMLLAFLWMFMPGAYPFAPLQMTPINTFTVGIPSFFLALRNNYQKPAGQFAANILRHSLPSALTVVFNILVIYLASVLFGLSQAETSTMNVLLTGTVGFLTLWAASKPLEKPEYFLLGGLSVAFLLAFFVFGEFFNLESLLTRNAFFYLPLMYTSVHMVRGLSRGVVWVQEKYKLAFPKKTKRVV